MKLNKIFWALMVVAQPLSFTACSSSDDDGVNNDTTPYTYQTPKNKAAEGKYTFTVGKGKYSGEASLSLDANKTAFLKFPKKQAEVKAFTRVETEQEYDYVIGDYVKAGNVYTIYVGGASAVERGEVKLRVDDAVCAAKSALAGGVVAGGGVCLRDISEELGIPYLKSPYQDLLSNSGLEDDDFAPNVGYDLKSGIADDMFKLHIIDPAIVIKEAVINSHSVIAKLITTKLALIYEDREWNY